MQDKSMGIPQQLIGYWLWNSVTHDPILKDLNQLKEIGEINDVYNAVLLCIKKGQYDEVLMLVEALAEDYEIETLIKAKAILLASRFSYLHNLSTKAREIANKFEEIWNALGKDFFDFFTL